MEGSVGIDPITLAHTASGKIVFSEPTIERAAKGAISTDELLYIANDALEQSGYSMWILLDRLDVAFSDNSELEATALRALFKFYLDTKHLSRIRPKIFLRTDIWESITRLGFREASHIERNLTIQWKDEDLSNLILRRIVHNDSIVKFYGVNKEDILTSQKKQLELWSRIFPAQVETGPNKPTTFNWMLSRTRDATQTSAPREIVHLLNELRDRQIARLERGERGPADQRLFEQACFKDALPEVSRVRLHQTIYAEFPSQKDYIEALKDQKATQTEASLASLWGIDANSATARAQELESIGFFERTTQGWRVPFMYRPALNLVQGSAEQQT